MRSIGYWILGMLLILAVSGRAQDAAADTTVYKVAEEAPRFPGCEQLDTTAIGKSQCAQQRLLAFVYQNVIYPMDAVQNNLEGQVVVNFVVEKDGSVSNARVLKDIGGGCGLEVLRVVGLMNEAQIRWIPGKVGGKPVRANFNLPVRFRLQEAPPFRMVQGDTVYTKFDEALSFSDGDDGLIKYLNEKLKYPASGNDSCLVGSIDVEIIVSPIGDVRVLNMIDYSDLGFDFWYAATNAATSTIGKWKPAVYQGRKVPTSYELTMYFEPTAAGCKSKIDQYRKATELANEGSRLFNEGKQEEGLAKMGEAIQLAPGNSAFLFLRGQAYLDMNRLPEACADLSKAQSIALNDWYSGILPIICR